MIDFELTEDHKALVQTVREFAQKEVAPNIKEWDEKQHFEPSILRKMGELNLLGVCIPEEYGGAGFDYIALGLVCEELEAVDTFMRVVMSVHTGLNSLTLYTWGTEEQKQKYLVPQAKGDKIATYGLTEPGAGSDVVGARSTARREGNEWVLNGEKMWISLADVADNFLFFCWTDEEKRRKRDHTGMSARFTGSWVFARATRVISRFRMCECRTRTWLVKKVKVLRLRCLRSSRGVTRLQRERRA
jgi:glutaryl-CoA dehydrogenase (non-decarboxylating)